jgi:hypothetical protein
MPLSALHHFQFPLSILNELNNKNSVPLDLLMLKTVLNMESRIAFSTESTETLSAALKKTLGSALDEGFENKNSDREQSGNEFFLFKAPLSTKAKIFSPVAWTSYLISLVQYPVALAVARMTKNCSPVVKNLFQVLINLPPIVIKFLLDPFVSPMRNLTAIQCCIKNIRTPTAAGVGSTSATASGAVPAAVPVPVPVPAAPAPAV